MTATTDIIYENLRVGGQLYQFPKRDKPVCSWNSVLFDRYRYAEKMRIEAAKK